MAVTEARFRAYIPVWNCKRETAMSALTVSDEQATSTKAKVIQPAWVRAVHWTNAFAMVLMIMSGWQIYNASPLFDFTFSKSITLGGWLGGALLWHFAAMWLLMVNGLIYLTVGLATGRFRKKLLPITPEGVISDTKAALTGKLSHEDLTKYNQVQKLLYAGVIVIVTLILMGGDFRMFYDIHAIIIIFAEPIERNVNANFIPSGKPWSMAASGKRISVAAIEPPKMMMIAWMS